MTSPASPRAMPIASASSTAVPARLLLAFAGTALAFAATWWSFPATWLDKGGHQFFAAAFAGWLLWKARDRALEVVEPLGITAVAIGGLSLAWMAAYVLNVQVLHQLFVPVILLLWLVAVCGLPAGKAALPAFGVFMLAVPVWGSLTRPLQSMTVAANAVLLSVTDITAQIEGDYIAIPEGLFHVASGCAGLNYFEVGLFVSSAYALLFLQSWRARAVAVTAGVALAIVSNWLRVFGLIVIGHVTEMQSSLITDHVTYGWVIFAAVLALFFVGARRLERWDATQPAAEPHRQPLEQGHVDGDGLDHRARDSRAVSWSTLVAPTATALLGPLAYLGLSASPTQAAVADRAPGVTAAAPWTRLEAHEVTPWRGETDSIPGRTPAPAAPADSTESASSPPVAGDSVSGTGTTVPRWQIRYAGADRHMREQWTDGERRVQVDRVIYLEQRQGKELVNSENTIAREDDILGGGRVGPLDETGRMAIASVIRAPEGRRLSWHWYVVAGTSTHSGAQAKLLELIAFFTRDALVELVVVSTPCSDTECREAGRTLYNLLTGRETTTQ